MRSNLGIKIWDDRWFAYGWVMSRTNESCHDHIWMTPVTYKGVMLHMNTSCHYERTMSHVWMMQIAHTNEKVKVHCKKASKRGKWWCCTHEWVLSHMNKSCYIWMSHVTYEWVTSWMRPVTYFLNLGVFINCHKWAMSRIWMRERESVSQDSHQEGKTMMSHTNESCHM